jgi:hypothetical protein
MVPLVGASQQCPNCPTGTCATAVVQPAVIPLATTYAVTRTAFARPAVVVPVTADVQSFLDRQPIDGRLRDVLKDLIAKHAKAPLSAAEWATALEAPRDLGLRGKINWQQATCFIIPILNGIMPMFVQPWTPIPLPPWCSAPAPTAVYAATATAAAVVVPQARFRPVRNAWQRLRARRGR